MQRYRVLHVTPYGPDAWGYGGIPRLAATIARGLTRRGHDVVVCTTDACDASSRLTRTDGTRTSRRPWPPTRAVDGVVQHVFPNVSNRLAYHQQLFLPIGFDAFMRREAASFDVAHLHACRNGLGAIAAHHLEKAGVPYVLAPNGTAPRIERKRFAKRVYDAFIGHRVLASAARVLAVSDAERRQFCDLGMDSRAVRVIPNPIDLDEFAQPIVANRFRSRLQAGDAPVVLFLGKITRRKRVDDLVRAFATVKRADARLVIAGNDMGAERSARRLVHRLGLSPRTVFTGLLTGRDRLEALADADVVAYPSSHEIFGLVPLEALLSGTPVVVADDCGAAEVIRQTGGGQVVPVGDITALRCAIEDVLEQPAAWRARTAAAALRVRALYAPDAVCGELDTLYGEIVH